jgi:hypothetical protein
MELFPGIDIGRSDLTIVTLSQKTTTDLTHTGLEVEIEQEKVTKFVRIIAFSMSTACYIVAQWYGSKSASFKLV